MKKYGIGELAFNIVDDSEAIEGFRYTANNVDSSDKSLMKNISKEVILEFLQCDGTKVWAVKNEAGDYDIIAYNKVSKEQVRVSGLGNHFMALIKIVKEAEKKTANPDQPLLTNKFIKSINQQILLNREGEVGIGEYRYKDYFGRPIVIGFGKIDNGQKVRTARCVELEPSIDKNIYKKMDELVDWVNNEAFKDENNVMADIAQFHARFIKIHPFCDGNGRTCRLLTNYLLLTQGLNMLNVPANVKRQYILALNYANAKSCEAFLSEGEDYKTFYEKVKAKFGERSDENKYLPLTEFLKKYTIVNSNDLINEILNYRGNNLRNFSANQIPCNTRN